MATALARPISFTDIGLNDQDQDGNSALLELDRGEHGREAVTVMVVIYFARGTKSVYAAQVFISMATPYHLFNVVIH